jgi:hypothetical protein
MTDEKSDLVKRAETALAGLPLREPDWDAFASRLEGARASAAPEDPALFDAPLPATSGDGELPITAAAVDSVPAPRESGEILRSVQHEGPTLSVAPSSSDELDDEWTPARDALAAPGEDRVPSPLPEAPPAAAITEVVDEAEDLTAHAATEDSAPVAAVDPTPSRREPVSLAELARASVARRGTNEKANIALESLAVASQSRGQGEQIAQRVQAAASYAPGTPESVPPGPITERRPRPARSERGELLRGPWPGVIIGGVGLAAAFALYLSRPEPAPVTIVQAPPQTPAVAAEAPRAPSPESKPPATPAPERAREAALDPTSLPALPRETAPRAEGKLAEPAAVAAAKSPGAVPAPVAAAPRAGATGKVAAENIVLEEDPKAAAKPAPNAPAGPGDGKLRPAELSSGTMTDRPSAGAAQAAIGAVLGAARSCVAGHPQPSTAQLVFGSDGQVSSVTVGGPAAGTPAAACIESALKKARVQPFAASSFSLGVTVRPP